jgi:type IV secretory pathway VirB2 component (pilin)
MKLNLTMQKMTHMALALFAAYAVMLLPTDALAQFTGGGGGGGGTGVTAGGTPQALAQILCNVVEWFTGPVGAGIATLAIIVIGIGALMGKVSWGMAIIVGIGVGVIFGAPTIVDALGADSTCI